MPTYDVDVAGLTYEVDAPDENTAWRWANYEHRKRLAAEAAKPQPEGGFFPAMRAGFEGLKGAGAALAGKVGLMPEEEAQAAYEAAQKRQKEIFKPTEEGWTEAPFQKFKETLGGSVPYMAAPLAVGAAAATLPVSGPAAAATALGAAGLASATQFTATNLARQLDTGKKLAETDLGNAALAAVPMALLDTLSLRLLPGVGRLLGDAGITVTKETAKEISEQILKKAAIDYTAQTGKAMGREGLTEAAQQALERLQAGLNLTDPEARQEYLDSLIGGAVLGGAIAPVGRYAERGRAAREVGALETAEADAQRAAAAEAEKAKKESPEYIEGVYDSYQQLLQQQKALEAQIKKGSKEAPLSQEDKDSNAVVTKQLDEIKSQVQSARRTFIDAGGPQAMAKLRAGRLELTPPPGKVTEPSTAETLTDAEKQTQVEELTAQLEKLRVQIDSAASPEEAQRLTEQAQRTQVLLDRFQAEAPEAARARAAQQVRGLTDLLEQQRTQLAATEDPEEAVRLGEQTQRTYGALSKAQEELDKFPAQPAQEDLQKKLKSVQKKFETARGAGDQDKVVKYGRELLELRQQLRAYAPDTGLFAPELDEAAMRERLGEEIGAQRKAAALGRWDAEAEQAAARQKAERDAAVRQQLEEEGAAEREALTGLAQEQAAGMRARELGRVRAAPQLGLFPEEREMVTSVRTTDTRVAGLQNELAQQLKRLRQLTERPEPQEGLPDQAIAGPYSLRERTAEQQAQIAAVERRIEDLRGQIDTARAEGSKTRVTRAPASVLGTTPEVAISPKDTLVERVNKLAETALASPRVDEDTKTLITQVQDALPRLTALISERPQEVALRQAESPLITPRMEERLKRKARQAPGGRRTALQDIGAWLYRTNTGRAAPEDTARVQELLQMLETPRLAPGRTSEAPLFGSTVRRAVTPKPPVAPKETQAEREARDAEKRREEQARLEQQEAPVAGPVTEPAGVYAEKGEGAKQVEGTPIPRTLIEFERDVDKPLADEAYAKLVEKAYDDRLSSEERVAAGEKADAYLENRISKLAEEAELQEGKAATHQARLDAAERTLTNLRAAREKVKLTVREKKKIKTPEAQQAKLKEKQDKFDAKIAEVERKIKTHQKNLSAAQRYPTVKRTDPTELKAYRQALNEEILRDRARGERLGPRAIGPVTRPEVFAPRQMLTGSEESALGKTTTQQDTRLKEAVGLNQRDVPMSKKEMAEAQAQADAMKTLEGVTKAEKALDAQFKAAKERGLRPGELERFRERQEILTKRKDALRELNVPVPETKTEIAAEEPTVLTAPKAKTVGAEEGVTTVEGGVKVTRYPYMGDVELSRGPTADPSTTASVRKELSATFPDLGRVQIFDSVEALVEANPQYEGRIPDDARGFVDSAGNKAFLIAENINKGDSLAVLLHEVGAHIGLKNMLGAPQYNALVKGVETWAKRNDNSPEARVAKAAQERVKAAKTPANQKDDETLAYAIEEAVKAGVTPTQTKSPLGQWLARVAQAFRKALEKFGLPPKALDAQGLVDMAFGAAKMEMAPAVPQMSRRMFLRGAGAVLGAMKLPPLSKEMNLKALRGVFEASLDAREAWVGALKTAVKNKGLGKVIDQYDDLYEGDSPLASFAQTKELRAFLEGVTYDENYQDDGYAYHLNELLSGKDGVKIVADLQQAIRAQGASLVEATQKMAKEKGLPEVGELFFTYAGERSGIAAEALKEAKDMVANGAPMEEVWNKTGWFQSADKKWRFEIDDSKAQFKFDDYYEALKEGNINDLGQVVLELGNILWHPALYKAYPGLKTLPVKLNEDSSSGELGAFGPDGIALNMAYHDPEGVLLHELQHYIQRQEGFTRGSSTDAQYLRAYNLKVLNSVRESYARMAEEATGIEKDLYERRVDAFDAGIDAAQDARVEAVKKLKTAAKEWRQAQASTSSELDALEKEYKDGVEASEKAFDDYIAASDNYSNVLKERNSTKAERDAAKAAVEAAEKTRKATQRPSINAYFAARDAVYAKRQAAHNVFLEVRSSNKDDIATAVETTIIAMLPKNSVFAKFAKLSIAEQAYQNMLGEIEARDVEERRKLSAEERAATRPYASQPQRREEILFSRNLPTASRVADQIIGKQPTVLGRIKKSLFGLSFRTQIIDNLAPLEHIARTSMDALSGAQMMYYLRKYGMRNHMTAEAIENGVAQVKTITRADGQKERVIEAVPGANIKTIVKRLAAKDVVKEAGSADAANRLFTLYMSAIRGENKGFDKLNFGRAAALSELQKIERELASPRLEPQDKTPLNARKAYLEKNLDTMPTEADFRAAKAEIDANPTLKKAFDEAREMYNEYNTDLLNFLVQTGAVSKDEAARLLRAKDYIPYYRMRGGNAELMIGGETPIRIGNLKDSPHLQELVGGEEPIFDFLTSSVQNTSMLLDMGLRNIAAKNVAYELADAGLASKPAKVGKAGAPKGTVEFKLDGEDYFVRVDTDYIGVPSDLLVKGMAGIPTMLPQGLRLLGIPAQVLRRAVTSTPVFAAKQLFRDSLSAYLLSGSDAPPLLSAVNQLRKASPLKARGITGGQTFTGTTEDMSRLLKEVQEGRPGWMKAFAKMEALAHKADAATRQSQYESYRAQGLSDMEAELMALESMNFSKRGLSPTMHMASMLVPFLNAQIQGLDVLYKALTGNMPFNDKLDLQRKLFTRGASMFALTLAYAAAMQDDEEYKNATPDQKYGNWFLRLPFLDEMAGEKVTLRVPIPFEVGYIFKALPEMLYNSMKSDQGAKEALDALNHILIQIVPGGSSMVPIEIGGAKIPVPVPIPAALKPLIEVGLGKSFFTGRDLESAREQAEVPGMRYRERTSEIAKYIGQSVNFSPIKIEALVNGYTGGLGLLMLQTLSLPLPKAAVAVPEKRWSELPLVGSMFQPADASNIIDGVYKDFQKVRQAKTTYDRLLERGETGKAQAFLQQNMPLIMLNQMAGEYRQTLGELTENERIVRGSKLTEEEKRKLLDRIKAAKIQIATSVRAALDRKTPQAVPA